MDIEDKTILKDKISITGKNENNENYQHGKNFPPIILQISVERISAKGKKYKFLMDVNS